MIRVVDSGGFYPDPDLTSQRKPGSFRQKNTDPDPNLEKKPPDDGSDPTYFWPNEIHLFTFYII